MWSMMMKNYNKKKVIFIKTFLKLRYLQSNHNFNNKQNKRMTIKIKKYFLNKINQKYLNHKVFIFIFIYTINIYLNILGQL